MTMSAMRIGLIYGQDDRMLDHLSLAQHACPSELEAS
jgi:hypothetical protein